MNATTPHKMNYPNDLNNFSNLSMDKDDLQSVRKVKIDTCLINDKFLQNAVSKTCWYTINKMEHAEKINGEEKITANYKLSYVKNNGQKSGPKGKCSEIKLFSKCSLSESMKSYKNQKDEYHAYAKKVLRESELRIEGYYKQYRDFKEMPLEILLGKKVPGKPKCKLQQTSFIQTSPILEGKPRNSLMCDVTDTDCNSNINQQSVLKILFSDETLILQPDAKPRKTVTVNQSPNYFLDNAIIFKNGVKHESQPEKNYRQQGTQYDKTEEVAEFHIMSDKTSPQTCKEKFEAETSSFTHRRYIKHDTELTQKLGNERLTFLKINKSRSSEEFTGRRTLRFDERSKLKSNSTRENIYFPVIYGKNYTVYDLNIGKTSMPRIFASQEEIILEPHVKPKNTVIVSQSKNDISNDSTFLNKDNYLQNITETMSSKDGMKDLINPHSTNSKMSLNINTHIFEHDSEVHDNLSEEEQRFLEVTKLPLQKSSSTHECTFYSSIDDATNIFCDTNLTKQTIPKYQKVIIPPDVTLEQSDTVKQSDTDLPGDANFCNENAPGNIFKYSKSVTEAVISQDMLRSASRSESKFSSTAEGILYPPMMHDAVETACYYGVHNASLPTTFITKDKISSSTLKQSATIFVDTTIVCNEGFFCENNSEKGSDKKVTVKAIKLCPTSDISIEDSAIYINSSWNHDNVFENDLELTQFSSRENLSEDTESIYTENYEPQCTLIPKSQVTSKPRLKSRSKEVQNNRRFNVVKSNILSEIRPEKAQNNFVVTTTIVDSIIPHSVMQSDDLENISENFIRQSVESNSEKISVIELKPMEESKMDDHRKDFVDKKGFDKLLDSYEKRDVIAMRLIQDNEFFNADIDSPKKESDEETSIVKKTLQHGNFIHFWEKKKKRMKIKNANSIKTDEGVSFTSKFGYDNFAPSGNICFNFNEQEDSRISNKILSNQEPVIDLSDKESPLDYLLSLGFLMDEANNALNDEDIGRNLLTAITEALTWTQKITINQGNLLYLIAYKTRPKIKKYYLQLIEAIIKKRIDNVIKLVGFLRFLEQFEDGEVQTLNIFGAAKLEEEEQNETKEINEQLKLSYLTVSKIAKQESMVRGKTLSLESTLLLRILVAKYRTGLRAHLELIARYIGQELLNTQTELETAMIFLSEMDTTDVKLDEFEMCCGIDSKIERKRSDARFMTGSSHSKSKKWIRSIFCDKRCKKR